MASSEGRFIEDSAAIAAIIAVRQTLAPPRAALIGISGIDASGKGCLAARFAATLRTRGLRVAVLNVDPWLHLPAERFAAATPAMFYRDAPHFDAMFAQLVEPLRQHGSIRLETDHADPAATSRHLYEFAAIDIVIVEGIFILAREHRTRFDLSIWVDCSFATALERAVARSQEGLPPEATLNAYRTLYFPAQMLHFEHDAPRHTATWVLRNDPRLISGVVTAAGAE